MLTRFDHRVTRGRRVFSPLTGVNGIKSAVLLGGLGGLFILVGSMFGQPGAFFGLLLGVGLAGGSYWYADRIALAASRAVPVSGWEMPEYHRIVRELCADAGLPMPRLYLTPDRQPNAFATGRDPDHAAVAVTQGLLDILTWDELRAVLAHELAHVGNRDILLTSVAAAIATGLSSLANSLMWLPWFAGSDDEEQANPLGLIVAAVFAPLAAAILQLALSRSREFEADAAGARLIGDGTALASALTKLDRAARLLPMPVEPAQSGKYIVNPLAGRHVVFSSLFATHPPVAERVRRLRSGTWRWSRR